MAGNIVKWWKHKILGGYKQFSVLQECTTDSEELIYTGRAASSCSAPPDLLLTSDRENREQLSSEQSSKSVQMDPRCEQLVNLENSKTECCFPSPFIKNTSKNANVLTPQQKKIEKLHENSNDRMCLEKFTCDVTCESGKGSQPLQFSFTFYDLDGHQGKISKDDIAGIVYTIYESVGKSVVVPHCGSKTINVRLTVSAESKTISAKDKIQDSSAVRRPHRHRPRKVNKSDGEENVIDLPDSGSDKECVFPSRKRNSNTFIKSHKNELLESKIPSDLKTKAATSHPQTTSGKLQTMELQENIYESMVTLKCCSKDCTKEDSSIEVQQIQNNPSVHHAKHAARAAKLSQRGRKQKDQYQYCGSRQRSLSVGSEYCWNERRRMKRASQVDDSATGWKDPSGESWNNALKRNDLIDIIRESMEKNRLCFQSNGKTTSNNSPVHYRHRQRSHTVSKVLDENFIRTGGPHIPVYHQQLAINPAILSHNIALHHKSNLCGYDSFLHATICASAKNASSSAIATVVPNEQQLLKSPKNGVNDNLIKNASAVKISQTGYHSQQNSPQFHGYRRLSKSHHGGYPKLNTNLLNYLNPQLSADEKLHQTIDHVEKWLKERDQQIVKSTNLKMLKSRDEGKFRKDEKNYDNFLSSKLAETLKDTPNRQIMNSVGRDKSKIHNYQLKQRLDAAQQSLSAPSPASGTESKFVTLTPVNIDDPIEREHLIHSTTSEEENDMPSQKGLTTTDRKERKRIERPCSARDCVGRDGEQSSATNSNHSSYSSMFHHYVHEHIHHHYHHFEEKEN